MEAKIAFSTMDNFRLYDEYTNNDRSISQQGKPEDMRELVDNDSEEWYFVGPYQVQVPITALTEKGTAEYRKNCARAETESPKGRLTGAVFEPVSTGPWYPCKDSPHYKTDQMGQLNCMTDRVLKGYQGDECISTNKVHWFGTNSQGYKWIVTNSGSLYFYTQ